MSTFEEDHLRILLGINVDEVKTNPIVAPLLKLTIELVKRNHQMELHSIHHPDNCLDKQKVREAIIKRYKPLCMCDSRGLCGHCIDMIEFMRELGL